MLDCDGNIDSHRLERELRAALDADIKYKQTDNMKKKACKVAGSYDEFKAMVNCAHLKTLNRKEIESLKDVKKGWQFSSTADASRAQILLDEFKADDAAKCQSLLSTIEKPKNASQFERDWRRLCSTPDKLRYLSNNGRKRSITMMGKTGNAEMFEDVIFCLISQTPSSSVEGTSESNESTEQPPERDEEIFTSSTTRKWLKGLVGMDGFDLMIQFVSTDNRTSICDWLSRYGADDDGELHRKYSP